MDAATIKSDVIPELFRDPSRISEYGAVGHRDSAQELSSLLDQAPVTKLS